MLNAAGIYMTERDRHTEDSMMMRGRYCTANSNSRIYKRLGDRHDQFATVEDVRNQSPTLQAPFHCHCSYPPNLLLYNAVRFFISTALNMQIILTLFAKKKKKTVVILWDIWKFLSR
jgi:hypothetical protein